MQDVARLKKKMNEVNSAELSKLDEKQLKKIVEDIELELKQVPETKSIIERDWNIDKEMYEIILRKGNLEPLSPKYKYELDPKYQELLHKKYKIKLESEIGLAKEQLDSYDLYKEVLENKLIQAKAMLKKEE